MEFSNITHNNSQLGEGERLHVFYRATAVTFVMVGIKVLRGKKGERGVRDLKSEIQESLYTFTPLPTLPCSTSLFYSSSCALVSGSLWGGSVYFEHTASRAGENEDRGGME